MSNPYLEFVEDLEPEPLEEEREALGSPDANPYAEFVGDLEPEPLGPPPAAQIPAPAGRGRAVDLSRDLGVPVEFAERNLDELERAKKIRDTPWVAAQRSPAIQRALEDVDLSPLVLDDVPAFVEFRDALERRRRNRPLTDPGDIAEVVRNRFELGRRMAFELDEAVMPLLLSDLGLGPEPTADQVAQFDELLGRPIGPIDAPGALDDALAAPVEQLPILLRTIGAGGIGSFLGGITGAALGAGTGLLTGGSGSVPGAITGGTFGAKVGGGTAAGISIGKLEAAAAYTEFRDLTDAQGQPLPPDVVAAGAVTVGAINAGIEFAGTLLLPGASRLFGQGRRAIQSSIRRQMLDPAKWPALRSAAREWITSVAGESLTEAVQEAVNVEVGRSISGDGVGIPTEEERGRILQAGVQGALATAPIAVTTLTIDRQMQRIGKARERAQRIDAARQAIAEAGVRGASPRTFEALTSEIAKEAGLDRIRIPAGELIARYEEAGLSPDLLLEDAPEVAERISEALASGGDVEVRAGTYFAKLEPRLGDALTPDLRLDRDGLTAREADLAEAALESEADAVLADELAADESVRPEVRVAAREAGLDRPLFADAASAGMSDAEFAVYQEVTQSARARAELKLQKQEERIRTLEARRIAKENSRFNRARREAIKEATKEVAQQPVYQAIDFLAQRVPRETEAVPGAEEGTQRLVRREASEQRLDIGVIESEYGREWVDRLPRNILQRGGLHPDSVAELFGYQSGWELVQAIVSAPDRDAAIEDGARARLIEEFGSAELDPPPAIDPVIDEGVRALLLEERALAKRAGRDGEITPWDAAQAFAERQIASERVGSISAEAHARAAQKLAREAVEWLAEGNYTLAQSAKRQQILQLAQEKQARTTLKALERARKDLERWSKRPAQERMGKAQGGYQDQANQILERFGFRSPEPEDPANPRVAFGRWAAEREAEGDEVIAPDWIRDGGQPIAWKDLTAQQVKDVRDSVANIASLARRELQIRTGAEREQLATVEERIAETIRNQFPEGKTPKGFTKTKWEQAKSMGRAFDASLTFKEFIIDALTGNDPGSFLRRFVWEPLEDAQSAYNQRLAEYTEKLNALVKAADLDRRGKQTLPESRLSDKQGNPRTITKWELIAAALNLGNASNKEKLLEGYGWDERVLASVLDQHMTREDWTFVQGAWDLIDSLWPEVAALERRVTGVAPPKIQSQSVTTPFGTFRGGYFPVAYDPAQSQLGQRIEAATTAKNRDVQFTRATTGHGHTRERTRVVAPLLLSPDVITSHVDQVLLDLTHREALRDAGRVLSRPKVDAEIQRALGEEFGFKRYWDPWLHNIARDVVDPGGLAVWEKAVRGARIRSTVFKLGFRASTLLLQPIGLLNGFRVLQQSIGGKAAAPFLRGFFLALGNGSPRKAGEIRVDIAERSAFMRDRIKSLDRDIRDAVRSVQRSRSLAKKPAEFAMELIGRMQRDVVDVPIWLAAYHHALGKAQMSEERAVRFADSIVRKSQGSGGKMSQSAFQQGSELFKALTMFYSYNNLVYNQLFHTSRSRDVPGLLANYAMFALFPGIASAVMYAIVKGEIPNPDDDDFDEQIRGEAFDAVVMEVASTVPFVRDFNSFRYTGRPKSSSVFEMIYQEVGDALNPKDGMDVMFDALRLGALATGMPGDYVLREAEDALRDED